MSSIYFAERGSGIPLVLIHGFCENHEIWNHFSEELSLHFRVIMPDLPGFGKSPLPATPFTIDEVGSEMLRWLDESRITRPVVIGHSLGGYVALAMASQQPESFPGIGLFHSTIFADSLEKKQNRDKVIDFVKRNGVEPFIETFVPGLFYKKDNPHQEEVRRIARQTRADTLVAYAAAMRDRPSRESFLATFRRPILMIAGEQDAIVTYEQSSAQVGLMLFPSFYSLPGTGHMGMFENEPMAAKIVTNYVNLAAGIGD